MKGDFWSGWYAAGYDPDGPIQQAFNVIFVLSWADSTSIGELVKYITPSCRGRLIEMQQIVFDI
jgi:hypothetical protein